MKTEDDTNCCVKYILKCCRCFFILYEEYFMYICREAFLEVNFSSFYFRNINIKFSNEKNVDN